MDEKRVMIFIDGNNLYHIIKKICGLDKSLKFNFKKFCEYINKDGALIGIYYYMAPLDRKKNKEKYIKQQKFFEKIKRIPNFNLILCRMQKVKINNKTVYQVKEDDIHLAVDMVDFAHDNFYDTAILVSSDGDFVPAIKAVRSRGEKVKNIGFETKFSYHLKQECDSFIKISKEETKKFFN